jgi:hypothetical protein
MIIGKGFVVELPTWNPSGLTEIGALLSNRVYAESNLAAGAHRIVAASLRKPSFLREYKRNADSPGRRPLATYVSVALERVSVRVPAFATKPWTVESVVPDHWMLTVD